MYASRFNSLEVTEILEESDKQFAQRLRIVRLIRVQLFVHVDCVDVVDSLCVLNRSRNTGDRWNNVS